MVDVQVTITGPLFDGRAPAAVRQFLQEATYDVGAQGLADVHEILNRSIKHPTPYYETQVTLQRMAESVVVHDRGVVYGPWLEGLSSRNRTTRFRGYAAFRRAAQGLQRKVPALVEPALRRLVGRLG